MIILLKSDTTLYNIGAKPGDLGYPVIEKYTSDLFAVNLNDFENIITSELQYLLNVEFKENIVVIINNLGKLINDDRDWSMIKILLAGLQNIGHGLCTNFNNNIFEDNGLNVEKHESLGSILRRIKENGLNDENPLLEERDNYDEYLDNLNDIYGDA